MTATAESAGPAEFARYAFPPHELGYCGPADADGLIELGERAREFDGVWPYLTALAEAGGLSNPLDEDAVRSYWVGGALVDKVDSQRFLEQLRDVFAHQRTGLLDDVGEAVAHHSFHVFVVYPWVRFLNVDPTTPLSVLQQCRVRWGRVTEVGDERASIESRPLVFDGVGLHLGDVEVESVRWQASGTALSQRPAPGTWVSAHWDWICAPLASADVAALENTTTRTLALVNAVLARPKG